MRSNSRFLFLAAVVAVLGFSWRLAEADPNALWRIVSESCVPAAQQSQGTGKCTRVDLQQRYAVLKDIEGPAQYLLIPTDRIQGVESSVLLKEGTTNFWQAAWQARSLVRERVGYPLPEDAIGLEINSASRRSQQQLHIHVDCISPSVVSQLAKHGEAKPGVWTYGEVDGDRYRMMRVNGPAFDFNPFLIVARDRQGVTAMAKQTIFVSALADGSFLILNSAIDMPGGTGTAEGLLDHSCGLRTTR